MNTNPRVNIVSGFLALVLLILIFSFPLGFLWNKVVSALFCLPPASYWEMVGLTFFVYLLSRVSKF